MRQIEITFALTEGDLTEGKSRSCYNCPIGKAVTRALTCHLDLSTYPVAMVNTKVVTVCGHGQDIWEAELPDDIVRFIAGYDRAAKVNERRPSNVSAFYQYIGIPFTLTFVENVSARTRH